MTTATLPALTGAPTVLPPLCHRLIPGTDQPLCGAKRTSDHPVHSVQRCVEEGHGECNVCAELAGRGND